MNQKNTLVEILSSRKDLRPAIGSPGMQDLSYAQLYELVSNTVSQLNEVGIGRNDRVAIVLNNGPFMATAFISVACGMTAAPLNPSFCADEFEFYLKDLQIKALLVEKDSTSPAIAVAKKLGIMIMTLLPSTEIAGQFVLEQCGAEKLHLNSGGWAQKNDIALILHTSGTTSRPKIVPLSQTNVCTSAMNIAATLDFEVHDRGINIMPLFHIHGLIAGVLAPLSRGSFVSCTLGFNAMKFFSWMNEVKPTWYTAVPTMHQAILTRAKHNQEIISQNPLRFIRSSSASMPTKVITDIEQIFQTQLIESYGMTEASHQMCSNLLSPGIRKPGTVGIAQGVEVAIINEKGELLKSGLAGEIVIKGPNITVGYENNPQANTESFINGWFRTGDLGSLDSDGYLTITGRSKEIINRGGEKISPREVDEILLNHPAIQQALTFAMPHEKLGEEVAALVVLHDGYSADEKSIREFSSNYLADFKIPKNIIFMTEIPKGATGKMQRVGLAQRLNLN